MSDDDRIRVHVMSYGKSRKFLQLRWIDPRTGKWRAKSSGCTKRNDAFRAAAALEAELNGLRFSEDGSMPWATFRGLYQSEHGSSLAVDTRLEIRCILNQFERLRGPTTIRSVDSRSLSLYAADRRKEGTAEDTIAKDLRHIKHALRWAVDQQYLPALPVFPVIKRKRKGRESKGRPITDAEFAVVLAAIPGTAGIEPGAVASWEHLLRGLWLSGLRISEAMSLRWEPGNWLSLDASDPQRPKLRIPGTHQKSGEDQLLPLTPDFGQFAVSSTVARSGHVFSPLRPSGQRMNAVSDTIRQICAIGEKSGVVVDPIRGKTVSAHDLRRSFGARWSVLVMPAVLQELMRHATISTTMKYYVGQSVDRTHDAILQAVANRPDITGDITKTEGDSATP